MPTITKRGDTYRIRAYCGYDAHGKQVTRSTTWKPAPGMSPKQIEKELQRQAVLFQEKCSGQGWGGSAGRGVPPFKAIKLANSLG